MGSNKIKFTVHASCYCIYTYSVLMFITEGKKILSAQKIVKLLGPYKSTLIAASSWTAASYAVLIEKLEKFTQYTSRSTQAGM